MAGLVELRRDGEIAVYRISGAFFFGATDQQLSQKEVR